MDGSSSKPDSKFRLDKCTHGEHEVDRLSQLPDEIILVILSFLSLREAAATSVLSSRWPHLWKHTCNLNFNSKCLNFNNTYEVRTSMRGKYIEVVNSVLQSHKAPSLKAFRICLYVDQSYAVTVKKWLQLIFARRVESLELDFLDSLPRVVLQDVLSKSNTSLIFFKSLKSLCLKNLKISGEDIKLFLQICPLLERLTIHSTHMQSIDVEVCGATLALNHLDMVYVNIRGSLRVSAPNLTWFGVAWTCGKLLLENTPKLVEARITYNTVITPSDAQQFTSQLSRYIPQLKILNLNLHEPEVFMASGVPEFPNLNKLVVRYNGTTKNSLLPAVTALIWASPRLQEFRIEFISADWREDEKPCVEVIPSDERNPHQHLRVFEFHRFHGKVRNHYKVVTYVSNKCVALRKINIDYGLLFREDCKTRIKKGQRIAMEKHIKRKLEGKVPDHVQLQLHLVRL